MTPPFSWTAEAISAWSQIALLMVALIAAGAAFYQLKAQKTISREAEAQESFRDYLRLVIENDGIDVRSTENEQRYHYLVVFMLTTFEKIFELSRADECWLTTMKGHILWHKDYLTGLRPAAFFFYESFDPNFAAFVTKTLDEG